MTAPPLRAMAEHRSDMDVIDFTPNPIALLHKASRVVLMGGYNSVCEVLTTEIPALVVPRVRPRSEQLVRAEALAARNMIDVLRSRRRHAGRHRCVAGQARCEGFSARRVAGFRRIGTLADVAR